MFPCIAGSPGMKNFSQPLFPVVTKRSNADPRVFKSSRQPLFLIRLTLLQASRIFSFDQWKGNLKSWHHELIDLDFPKTTFHDGVITDLEPDILECEVKWALESITMNKASRGDGIPLELFQILKDDAVKVLHLICQQIWKTQQWPQDWKRSVFIPIPKKGNAKKCSNYRTIALISHASKVMLKILQARLQQYVNRELPDVQPGFRNSKGTRDQIANIRCIIEKAREFQKKSITALLTMPKSKLSTKSKPLTVWITINCGKF